MLHKLSSCNEAMPSCKEFLERNLIFPENLKVIVWGDPSKYPSAESNLVNPGKNLSAELFRVTKVKSYLQSKLGKILVKT